MVCGDQHFVISEIALFAPGHLNQFFIEATGSLTFLELCISLSSEDLIWATQQPVKPPFFKTYSDCQTYREVIKSAKTVSRTLMPVNIIPRFCAGSVQTTGPDLVGAHRHGMLEQLFLGLPGNDCRVHVDEASCAFRGNDLLQIPLGS